MCIHQGLGGTLNINYIYIENQLVMKLSLIYGKWYLIIKVNCYLEYMIKL